MSIAFKIAAVADRLGLRRSVAALASIAYPASRFSVDDRGRWVNRQAEATFVNTAMHTTSYAAAKGWVLYNWAWQYLPQPGDIVIDVGAGIGEEAVVFSHLVGAAGRVISIEAHPETFGALQETVRLSGLTNVTCVNCAISDADGHLFISTTQQNLGNSVIGQSSGLKVPARSLDSLTEELGIEEVALLKMNIEGAERMAVRGMKRLAPNVRYGTISCHDFLAERMGGSEEFRVKEGVRRTLEELGFMIKTRPEDPDPWVRDYLHIYRPE